jgi:hypothetical protein
MTPLGNALIDQWNASDGMTRAEMVKHLVEKYPDLVCAVMRSEGKCRKEKDHEAGG